MPPVALSPVVKAIDSLTRSQAAQVAAERRARESLRRQGNAAEAVPDRDARGRFSAGNRGDSSDRDSDSDADGKGLVERMKDFFNGARVSGGGEIEKIDPTIEAAKEVGSLVSAPLNVIGKAGKSVIGQATNRMNSPTTWFRRILGVLKGTRDDASAYHVAEGRVLKDIARKTGEGARGSSGGSLRGLLSGTGGLFRRLLGGPLALGRLGLRLGKFGLRRLPLLGALFAGGSALASMFGPDDPTKSAAENRQSRFKGAGSGIGAIVGGVIGTALGGPIGTVIGGVIGDRLGEVAGEWLSTVDWSKIGAQITNTWDSAVSFIKDSWKTVADKLAGIAKSVTDALKGIGDGIATFLKEKFGIDIGEVAGKVKEAAQKAVDKAADVAAPAVEAAKEALNKVKETASAAVDYGKERVEKMAEPIGRTVDSAVDWGKGLFGKGSKGNQAALMKGMIAAGITDRTEQAMFLAQMDHESGGFRSLEENIKYKPKTFLKLFGKRAGITTEEQAKALLAQGPEAVANAMYGGAWGKKNLGNTQDGDALRFKGRGFTQLTGRANYEAAAKGTGLDLINRPELAADPENAAKIAAWYWNSRKGLSDAGKRGDILEATKKINGGTNGLQDRKEKFAKYSELLKAPGFVSDATAKAAGAASEPAKMGGKPPAAAPAAPAAPNAPAQAVTPATAPNPAPSPAHATVAPGAPAASTARADRVASAASAAGVPPVIPAAPAGAPPVPPMPAVLPPVVTPAPPPAPPRVRPAQVSIPTAMPAPPTAQAPIQVPLSSREPMEVRVSNEQPVGQDLRDRRLAQIATGGISL